MAEVTLDPDEEAALAAAENDDDSATTMPTDEELDALLRGEAEPPEKPAGMPPAARPTPDAVQEDAPSPAAVALAAEMDARPAVAEVPAPPPPPHARRRRAASGQARAAARHGGVARAAGLDERPAAHAPRGRCATRWAKSASSPCSTRRR